MPEIPRDSDAGQVAIRLLALEAAFDFLLEELGQSKAIDLARYADRLDEGVKAGLRARKAGPSLVSAVGIREHLTVLAAQLRRAASEGGENSG